MSVHPEDGPAVPEKNFINRRGYKLNFNICIAFILILLLLTLMMMLLILTVMKVERLEMRLELVENSMDDYVRKDDIYGDPDRMIQYNEDDFIKFEEPISTDYEPNYADNEIVPGMDLHYADPEIVPEVDLNNPSQQYHTEDTNKINILDGGHPKKSTKIDEGPDSPIYKIDVPFGSNGRFGGITINGEPLKLQIPIDYNLNSIDENSAVVERPDVNLKPTQEMKKIDQESKMKQYFQEIEPNMNEIEEDSPIVHILQKRKKRSVVASTNNGVPINSEPYAQRKHKPKPEGLNKFFNKGYTVTSEPARPSVFGTYWPYKMGNDYSTETMPQPLTTAPPLSTFRHTPVMNRLNNMHAKSLLKSGDTGMEPENPDANPDFTIVRPRYGQTNAQMEVIDEHHPRLRKIKPLPVAHFSGDTSRYVLGQHTNYNGNGHLRHPQRTFVDWVASSWVQSAGMDTYFSMKDGIATVKENGLYFIYAQVYYLDEHDTMGYRVYKNADLVLQCTVTQHSSIRKLKGNTCFTAGTEYLAEGDAVSVADITEGKYSLFEPGKSFFGIIRIGEVKLNI